MTGIFLTEWDKINRTEIFLKSLPNQKNRVGIAKNQSCSWILHLAIKNDSFYIMYGFLLNLWVLTKIGKHTTLILFDFPFEWSPTISSKATTPLR
jgi:hypothetical protein